MTKDEAIKAMESGKKVRHKYFFDDEWMTLSNGMILFEDTVTVRPEIFWLGKNSIGWQDGYEVKE